jgi:Tfp pilus assembly protein PilO
MKISTKRILSILFALGFLLATLVVYGSFIKPALTDIGTKRSELASKEFVYQSQFTAVQSVKKLIDQFQSIAQVQQIVSLAMPSGQDMTQALNQLQAMIAANQVSLTDFTATPGAFLGGPVSTSSILTRRLGPIDLAISVKGSYEALKGLVRSIENNVRVANVKSFTLSQVPGPQNSYQDLYSLNLTVEIYYQERSQG